MQVFITLVVSELTLQWINPGHHRVPLFIRSLKNLCFIFTHRWVSELRMFVYVVMTKEITTIFLQ